MFKRVISPQELVTVVAFLNREPQFNHFLLADIEWSTLRDENLTVWAEEPLTAVMVRYYGNYLLYAPDGADWAQAARLMMQYGYGALSGKPEYIRPLLQHLSAPVRLETHIFMALEPGRLRKPTANADIVRVTAGNLERYIPGMVELRRSIREFHSALNVDALREDVLRGCKRIALVQQGDAVAAMAMTAERAASGMIVSVCTAQAWRGRGYAGQVTAALCEDLARDGKQALLFFCNPVAGRIYAALGFEDIGRWCMASF